MTELIETLREELAEAKARHAEELTTVLHREDALRSELAVAKTELEHLKVRYENRSRGFDAVARERDDARARVGELEATLRKCREATVDRINDAAHGCSAEPMQELIDAALAAAPPEPTFRVICGCICYCSPGDKVCWKCGHPAHESSGAVHGGCCEFTAIPRSTAPTSAEPEAAEGEPEKTFKCKTCGKIVPNEDGGDDDMPDSCSDCWWRNDIESRISALESGSAGLP